MERIAELVRLRLLEAFAEATFFRNRVIAEALAPQPRVDLAERLLADHP